MHDRTMRSRRRGLNPTKIVFVYCLAFLLVSIHQAGRTADWFEDLALGREGLVSELSFRVAYFLRDRVAPWGPAQINRAEDWVLARFTSGPAPRPGGALFGTAFESVPARPERPAPPVSHDRLALQDQPDHSPLGNQESPPAELPPPYWALDARPTRPSPPPDDQILASLPPRGRPSASLPAFKPARVLLLGDSMMLEGLGPPLQRELKKNEGLAVFRDGRYGTGLARLDNFDWLSYFDQMLDKYQPDLIILTIGANDTQDMIEDGRRLPVGGEAWTETYARRVSDLLARADARKVRVFWVSLPIMGQEPYGSRAAHINQVVEAVCRVTSNCRYWDSWLSVADAQGRFSTFLPDDQGRSVRVRAKDSIHLTEVGGRIMAEKFLAETASWADYQQDPASQSESGADQGTLRPLAPSAGDAEDDDGETPVGTVSRHQFFSRLRNKETPYLVVTPDSAGPGRGSGAAAASRPVVFLLHGAWDGYEAWTEQLGPETLARLAAERGLILVMPDGEPFGWYLDGRETAIESYLTTELIPRVLAEYPQADPDRLGLTGLSMGGHGALTLALKHPTVFKAVGSMSGVVDLAAHAGRAHPADANLRIDRVLGPAGPGGRDWRPHSALGLTEQRPSGLAGRPLIISVGRGDGLTLAENQAYHQLLTRLKIDHVYLESPGGHDWKYWAAQLPVHLDFMADKLKAGSIKN